MLLAAGMFGPGCDNGTLPAPLPSAPPAARSPVAEPNMSPPVAPTASRSASPPTSSPAAATSRPSPTGPTSGSGLPLAATSTPGAPNLPASPTPAGLVIRFDPDPGTGPLEAGALLQVEVQVPDRQGGTPETVLGVALELRDAADRPAISGADPAPPLNLLENAPTVWSMDFNAPTVPGVYHVQLSIRRRDGPPQTLTVARPLLTVVAPAPVSAGLVYARDGNLWLTSGDGQRTRALTFYRPAVEQATDPAWAPDGRRLAYTHRLPAPLNEIPGREIWSLPTGGTQAQPLVRRRSGEDLFAPAWSPDGRHLLVSVDRIGDPATGTVPPGGLLEGTESWAIDTVDLTSGARRPLFRDAREPDVSRDGAWVVYLAVAPCRPEAWIPSRPG